MNIDEAKAEFLLYISSVKGLAENSVLAYKSDLDQFTVLCGGGMVQMHDITLDDLRACVAQLSKKNRAASSINRFISSVRDLFAYCRKFDYIKINVSLNLKRIKIPKRIPRFMTQREVDAICAEPKRKPLLWEARDRALFEVFYSTGCRVSEIEGMNLCDIAPDGKSAVVTGKGKKDRRVYFEKDAQEALVVYLNERNARFPGLDSKSAVFLNQMGTRLTRRGMALIIDRYSGSEGTNQHLSPHAFRHTFATAMLSNGADIRVVKEMLGHSSISTTQRYTHITTEQLIETYNKAFPHGSKKHDTDEKGDK